MNLLAPHTERISTIIFAIAVLHTFLVKEVRHLARKFPPGSFLEVFFHLLGEVELVFGIWAIVFLTYMGLVQGWEVPGIYLDSLSFTEPLFVFAIIVVSASRPILDLVSKLLQTMASWIPLNREVSRYFITLTLGALLGSFITEPAAMTVSAMLLKTSIFDKHPSKKLAYLTLGTLFVNISIGGVLTSFAAPPVLMVASAWGWDSAYMMRHFGMQATTAVFLNALLVTFICRKEIASFSHSTAIKKSNEPFWLTGFHLLSLIGIVLTSHTPILFLAIFLLFIGVTLVTKRFQSPLKIKEGLLVGLFLGGLVVLGKTQSWWLESLLGGLSPFALFAGATGLTAFIDNAMITYLGAQVPNLSTAVQHALVAGAVTGGGLTVIANAPNPAGFSILQNSFGKDGINPLKLFLNALPMTLIAFILFWCFP